MTGRAEALAAHGAAAAGLHREELARLEVGLQARLGVQVRDLRLTALERGLILQGRARTYLARELAQQTLLETCDVPLVANWIEVS